MLYSEKDAKWRQLKSCLTRWLVIALIVVLLVTYHYQSYSSNAQRFCTVSVFVGLCNMQNVLLVRIAVLFAYWWQWPERPSTSAVAVRAGDGTSGGFGREDGEVGIVELYAVLRVLFGVRWPVWPLLVELGVPAALLALVLIAVLRRNSDLLLMARTLHLSICKAFNARLACTRNCTQWITLFLRLQSDLFPCSPTC